MKIGKIGGYKYTHKLRYIYNNLITVNEYKSRGIYVCICRYVDMYIYGYKQTYIHM